MTQGAQRSWPWRKPERSAALMKSAGVSWPQVSGNSSTKVTFSYTFMRLEESHWFFSVCHWWVKFEFGRQCAIWSIAWTQSSIAGKNRELSSFFKKSFAKAIEFWCPNAPRPLWFWLSWFCSALWRLWQRHRGEHGERILMGNPFGDLCHLMGSNI